MSTKKKLAIVIPVVLILILGLALGLYFGLRDNSFMRFEFNREGTLIKYEGNIKDLDIPQTYSLDEEGRFVEGEDYTLTAIGEYAFLQNAIIVLHKTDILLQLP